MKTVVLSISVFFLISCNALSLVPVPDGPLDVPREPGLPVTFPRPIDPLRPLCGPVCFIFCPNGNVLDSRGCPTCQCKPENNCERRYLTRSCRSCRYGRTYYTDSRGCRRCKCKSRPGPVCRNINRELCTRKFCLNGFRKDSRGCPTCECNLGKKSCSYNGRTYQHGTSFMKECNRCFCRNGRAGCTKRGCGGRRRSL